MNGVMNKVFNRKILEILNIKFKASATVEATLVIPIFVYASLAVMYVMQIVGIRSDVQKALYDTSKILSVSQYAISTKDADNIENPNNISSELVNGIDALAAHTVFIKSLGNDYAKKHNIVGGNIGMIVTLEKITDKANLIKITVRYVYKNPFDIFGIAIINDKQSITNEIWLGKNFSSGWEDINEQNEEKVYITQFGEVYHLSHSCRVLDIKIQSVPYSEIDNLRNEDGGKYYRCDKCCIGEFNTVYVTNYGVKYHKDSQCSYINRVVFEVPKSAVKDWRKCKLCGN